MLAQTGMYTRTYTCTHMWHSLTNYPLTLWGYDIYEYITNILRVYYETKIVDNCIEIPEDHYYSTL